MLTKALMMTSTGWTGPAVEERAPSRGAKREARPRRRRAAQAFAWPTRGSLHFAFGARVGIVEVRHTPLTARQQSCVVDTWAEKCAPLAGRQPQQSFVIHELASASREISASGDSGGSGGCSARPDGRAGLLFGTSVSGMIEPSICHVRLNNRLLSLGPETALD